MKEFEINSSAGNMSYAFSECSKLKDIYAYPSTAPKAGGELFDLCPDTMKIHIKCDSLGSYTSTDNWLTNPDRYELIHNFSSEWSEDTNLHWHNCLNQCGTKSEEAEHTASEWIVDQLATATETGLRHKECVICKYLIEEEIIPMLNADKGLLNKEVIEGPGTPATTLNNSIAELSNIILSADEVKQIASGESARIYLEIKNIDSTVSQNEKEKIDAFLKNSKGNLTVSYFDISLYKQIGTNSAIQIKELQNGKISITIAIPEKLYKEGREYQLLHIHNGDVRNINGIYDEKTRTFTFETDKFSTYAIVGIDRSTGDQNNTNTPLTKGQGNAQTPMTGDTTHYVWWIVMLSISGVAIVALGRKRRQLERSTKR